MSEIIKYLQKLSNKDNLTTDEMKRAFQITQLGGATPSQIAALISCLSMKSVTADEVKSTAEYFKERLYKSQKISLNYEYLSIQTNYNESFNLQVIMMLTSIIFAANNSKTICFFDKILLDLLSDLRINPSNDLIDSCIKDTNLAFIGSSKYKYLTKDTIEVVSELDIDNIFDLAKPSIHSTKNQIIKVKREKDLDLYKQIFRVENKKTWLIYNDKTEKLFDLENKIILIENDQIREFDLDINEFVKEFDFILEDITWRDFNKFILGEEISSSNYIINNAALCFMLVTNNHFSIIREQIQKIIKNKSISNIIKLLVDITS